MAQRDYDIEVPEFAGETWKERFDAEMAWYNAMYDEGVANYEATGSIVGCVWRHGIADGYAVYRVTSERPLRLAHIPIGDCWHAPDYAIRGLRKADIAAQMDSAIRWRKWAEKKAKEA